MNFLRKTACFLSVSIAFLASTSVAQSTPVCPKNTKPINKQQWNLLTAQQRIVTDYNWYPFEEAALNSVKGGLRESKIRALRNTDLFTNPDILTVVIPEPLTINRDNKGYYIRAFPSRERARRTQNTPKPMTNLYPDGFGGINVYTQQGLVQTPFANSAFYEVKALDVRSISKAVLSLAYPFGKVDDPSQPMATYGQYQILGLIDALADSPAGSRHSAGRTVNVFPTLDFLTTADVTIPEETRQFATALGVSITQRIACEVPATQPINPTTNPIRIQISRSEDLNPVVHEELGLTQTFNGPGIVVPVPNIKDLPPLRQ